MKRRIITSLIAIPVVLLAVASQTPVVFVLVLLACFICLDEASGLLDAGQPPLLDALPTLLAAVAAGILNSPVDSASHQPGRDFATPLLLLAVWGIWIAGLLTSWRISRKQISTIDRFLYSMWFSVPLLGLIFLHPFRWSLEPTWSLKTPLLLILIPVWAGDIAAMLAGRAFGRHFLAPKISPKKTWEGAIANLLAACAAGLLVGFFLGYPSGLGLAAGAVVGIFGQLGDLFESGLKRATGKKDSGGLLPGHGGLLDRIDSLIACVLPIWTVLWLGGVL